MLLTYLILILGFVALIYGADFLVVGATSLARKFRVSEAVIGLTIVAFGTSMPEFVVNVSAAIEGSGDIALANVIGSNIFNVLAILGCSSIVIPLSVDRDQRRIDIPVMIASALVVLLCAKDMFLSSCDTTVISRIDGAVLLICFVAYMAYLVSRTMTERSSNISEPFSDGKGISYWLLSFKIIGGLILLVVGGKIIVKSAIEIAHYWGVSERVIGLTIVSIGTSLPELATSVVAAFRKQADIAVTNIVGSNIFNSLFILGSTSVIRPVPVQNDSFVDLMLNLLLSIGLLLIVLAPKHRVERIPGLLMLSVYIAYVIYLI